MERRYPLRTHVWADGDTPRQITQDGKIIFHQDYFDGAAFIYEKIPILGAEIRFIKKRM